MLLTSTVNYQLSLVGVPRKTFHPSSFAPPQQRRAISLPAAYYHLQCRWLEAAMSATPAHHDETALPTSSTELRTDPSLAVPVSSDGSENIGMAPIAKTTKIITTTQTKLRKEAPPEKLSDIQRRSWVIVSFWLIVLCLGLPIWWKTTAIPRANLPLAEMMDWADGKV